MDEYIKTEHKTSDSCYFGYLKKNKIILWIFVQDENNEKKISKYIAELIAQKFYESPKFDLNHFKTLIKKVENDLNDYKNKNLEYRYSTCSLLCLLTDMEDVIAISIGNVRLLILESGEKIFTSKLDNVAQKLVDEKKLFEDDMINNKYINELTNVLGGLNTLVLNQIGPIKLKNQFIIIIQGIKAIISNKLELVEDSAVINFENVQIKSIKKSKNLILTKLVLIIMLFFSLIIFSLINNHRIKKQLKKIENLKSEIKTYEKNLEVQNIKINTEIVENLINEIYNSKLLYISKKNNGKINNFNNKINNIKSEIDLFDNQVKLLKQANEYIKKNQFIEAKNIYENMQEKIELKYIDNTVVKNQMKIKLKIVSDHIYLKEMEESANKYFESNNFIEAFKIYQKLINEYTKLKNEEYINKFLKDKYTLSKKYFEDIQQKANLDYMNAEENEGKNINLALKKYESSLEQFKLIGEENKVKEIEERIKILNQEIKLNISRANILKHEANSYVKQKKYKLAIECLNEVNDIFKILGLEEEIIKNNSEIRKIKSYQTISSQKTKKSSINISREEVLNSINLSIKKGDEHMKKGEWNQAILEYNRALEYSKSIDLSPNILDKLNKKLTFAIKKSKTGWFNKIWK